MKIELHVVVIDTKLGVESKNRKLRCNIYSEVIYCIRATVDAFVRSRCDGFPISEAVTPDL